MRNYKPMPHHLRCFYDEIDSVCKKYNLSISHEDSQGSFIIENYHKLFHNIRSITLGYTKWLEDACVQADIPEQSEELSWLNDFVN